MDGKHTFNLGHWLQRLGIKGQEIPPVVPLVQPVQVIGDASLLVPPLLPPTAFTGGYYAAIAPAHGAVSLSSRGEGGCLVRSCHLKTSAGDLTTFAIQDADLTWTNSAALTAHQMGPSDTVSVWTRGEVAAGQVKALTTFPAVYSAANVEAVVELDLIYVPRGKYLVFTAQTAGVDVHVRAVYQDLPASAGPE